MGVHLSDSAAPIPRAHRTGVTVTPNIHLLTSASAVSFNPARPTHTPASALRISHSRIRHCEPQSPLRVLTQEGSHERKTVCPLKEARCGPGWHSRRMTVVAGNLVGLNCD